MKIPTNVNAAMLGKTKNLYDLLCFCLVLSSGQISHLMTKISDSKDWRLTQPDLEIQNISKVTPDVVVGFITKMERVTIDVTPAQVQAIFTRLQFGGSKLKGLKLWGADLSAVTPEFLHGVLRVVEAVNFGCPMVASQDHRPGPRALQPLLTDGPDEGGHQGDEGRGPDHPGDSHSEAGGETDNFNDYKSDSHIMFCQLSKSLSRT